MVSSGSAKRELCIPDAILGRVCPTAYSDENVGDSGMSMQIDNEDDIVSSCSTSRSSSSIHHRVVHVGNDLPTQDELASRGSTFALDMRTLDRLDVPMSKAIDIAD